MLEPTDEISSSLKAIVHQLFSFHWDHILLFIPACVPIFPLKWPLINEIAKTRIQDGWHLLGQPLGQPTALQRQDASVPKPHCYNKRIQNKDTKQTKRLGRLVRNQRKRRKLHSCG